MSGLVIRGNRLSGFYLLERLLAFYIAILLLRSAISHIGNHYLFLSAIYDYKLVTIEQGKWAAMLIPSIQISLAYCLIFRWWIRSIYPWAILLFSVFFYAQYHAYQQDLQIACGCFSKDGYEKIGTFSLSLVGSCLIASILGWLFSLFESLGDASNAHSTPSDQSN